MGHKHKNLHVVSGRLQEALPAPAICAPCRKHERKQPQVVGYDTALLDRWVSSQEGKLVDLEGVGAFGAALLGHEADAGGAGSGGGSSLVSIADSRWQSER